MRFEYIGNARHSNYRNNVFNAINTSIMMHFLINLLYIIFNLDNFLKLENGRVYLTRFETVIIEKANLIRDDIVKIEYIKNEIVSLPQCTVVFNYNPSFAIIKSTLLADIPLTLRWNRIKIEINHYKQSKLIDDILKTWNW